ncbi:SET and MYND domain-containing protein 5 [Neolamprologus brichardi]|uniref:SET and MYND domain-containing protein 5 n=1 Tax=Neolamprologus brichardi TaxID=32507 RepID=UPI0003EBF625|nr:SET and MYND domain-containing protein 5 [Neolamprologus brichardi]
MAAPVDDMFSFCVDPGKVSSCVEVRFIDNVKGKGLFAKRSIKKGETIFIERPLVSAQFLWNTLYKYKACEYCLRALETAEGNARRLSGIPGLSLPHPELCRVRPEQHQACPQCQAKDKAHLQKLFTHFCSRTANEEEEIAHKLLGEQFRGQLALLHSLFTEALYDDRLGRWFVPEGFRSLFALVGTNGQGIGTSSLSQWVHACDALELPAQQREHLDSFIDQLYKDIEKETGDFLNCEGSGLFLLQSSCNHSCIPNAEVSFPDNNFLLHLSALCDINQGEEICISYLDCCQRDRSRHSRHKILRENYLFVCSCPKCVSQMEELDVTSEEEEEEEGVAEGETEGDEMEDEMTDV